MTPRPRWGGVLCRPRQRFRQRWGRNRGVSDPGWARIRCPRARQGSLTPPFPAIRLDAEGRHVQRREDAAGAVAGSVADPLARGSLLVCLMAFTIGARIRIWNDPAVCAPRTSVVSDRCCVDCLTIAWGEYRVVLSAHLVAPMTHSEGIACAYKGFPRELSADAALTRAARSLQGIYRSDGQDRPDNRTMR
jgi:hypothetical protein